MHWVRAATAWAPRVSTDPYHVIHTKVQKVIHCSLTLETPEAVGITGKWMTFFQKLSECSFFLPPSSYQAEISFFKKCICVRSWEPAEISIAGPLPKETPNPDRSPAKTPCGELPLWNDSFYLQWSPISQFFWTVGNTQETKRNCTWWLSLDSFLIPQTYFQPF